jgi:hypothetical protein
LDEANANPRRYYDAEPAMQTQRCDAIDTDVEVG